MSNIPEARELMLDAQKKLKEVFLLVNMSLGMMDRRKPDFRHSRENKRVTNSQRRQILALRKKGYSMTKIARRLGIGNTGRVSEVINGKAH